MFRVLFFCFNKDHNFQLYPIVWHLRKLLRTLIKVSVGNWVWSQSAVGSPGGNWKGQRCVG